MEIPLCVNFFCEKNAVSESGYVTIERFFEASCIFAIVYRRGKREFSKSKNWISPFSVAFCQ